MLPHKTISLIILLLAGVINSHSQPAPIAVLAQVKADYIAVETDNYPSLHTPIFNTTFRIAKVEFYFQIRTLNYPMPNKHFSNP